MNLTRNPLGISITPEGDVPCGERIAVTRGDVSDDNNGMISKGIANFCCYLILDFGPATCQSLVRLVHVHAFLPYHSTQEVEFY